MSTVAIVTGATQGLGFALAEGLAQRLSPRDVSISRAGIPAVRGRRSAAEAAVAWR